jgi:hypothetical protein
MGTVWFMDVLRTVADAFHLRFYGHTRETPIDPRADIFLFPHSRRPNFDNLDDFRGSHMIRDPRDAVVSSYFYHLWTEETWVHVPRPKFEDNTLHEHLQGLGQDEGIAVEMRRFAQFDLPDMIKWEYGRPDIIELRFEEVIVDQATWFARIFRHYGFHDEALARAVEIALSFSFERVTKRRVGEVEERSHLRSGQSGQWRDVFSPDHVALFKELAGPALVKLGYEADENW